MLASLKLTKFLEKTAAGTAVPGGGSVAALNAALAAGLAEMVANLTVAKKGYKGVEKEMKAVAATASSLRKKLVKGIDKDSAAYTDVMKAFKMPGNTDQQKAHRTKAIQAGLKNASRVPLDVARDAFAVMELAAKAIRKGNKNALTDGAVAVLTARAAILGALYNVKTNLNFIDDHKFVKEMNQEVKSIESRAEKKAKNILARLDI